MGRSEVPSLGCLLLFGWFLSFVLRLELRTQIRTGRRLRAVLSQQASHVHLWWLMCLLLSSLLGQRLVWIGSALRASVKIVRPEASCVPS